MDLTEAKQIKEYLLEIIEEKSNQIKAPDLVNLLLERLASREQENVNTEIHQVEQALSLLRIYAFPPNKDDVETLIGELSAIVDSEITKIDFYNPLTQRTISLNEMPAQDNEETELRRVFDSLYPSFENEFDSFEIDNSRANDIPPKGFTS